jgi:3-hydroxyacyl-CoA dehydrogenase
VSTAKTSESTTRTLISFGEKIGKSVITCRDTPGFVVNRLLVPFMAEAMRMVRWFAIVR